MSLRSDFVWFDGKLVPFDQATTHVLSHTLHYGMGVFEGIRAYEQPDGRAGVWRLDPHLRRFLDSLKMIGYACPYTHAQLRDACLDTLAGNQMSEAYIRPLAFLGLGRLGLGARDNPLHVIVATWKWGAYLGDEGLQRGIRACTSTYSRPRPAAVLQRAKVVGHYVNSILARYEANEAGFDEAILLDANGYVAEGTGENVFVVRDGVVHTPPNVNILPGITRESVIDILRHEGVDVREQFFGRDAFWTADEAFMCGTAAEVTPIRELDRRAVGNGEPGPVTKLVQRIYLAAVRGHVEWLHGDITMGRTA
jgi:branched-chain amino acid aminotransferase